jgi:hypothetical protein
LTFSTVTISLLTGYIGPTGAAGVSGPTGPQGISGVRGPIGFAGPTGWNGRNRFLPSTGSSPSQDPERT